MPGWTPRGSRSSGTARPPSTSCDTGFAMGDVVLVKASRGIELDLLVDALATELGPAT